MTVAPALIRELREISGAGMTDCKKALEQSEGDIQKAVTILREKGLASAAKKAGRIAAEGIVWALISDDGKTGVVVEVNCETDFVAKNPEYRAFVENVAKTALVSDAADVGGLLNEKWAFGDAATVDEAVKSKIALYGENINIRRAARFKLDGAGFFQKYIHGEGKVAVLIEIESDVDNAAMRDAAKNVCMQITINRPLYIKKDDVDQAFLDQEREIMRQQTLNEGKDEKVADKIVIGKMNKRIKEVCLLEQEYIKENDITVGKYLEGVFKENNAHARVARFAVYEKGEGIAKKEENFAEEVSKAMQG